MPAARPRLRRLAAIAAGGLLALLAGEAAVRLIELARHGTASDRGGYSATFLAHHPRLGWLGVPGARLRHHTTEFDVEIALDSSGLRGTTEVASERAAGTSRIALLGDSFVFGQGVEEYQRIGRQLERGLADCEVVQLGLPAWGTDQALLAWSELEGPHRSADLVVLVFVLESVVRNAASARHGRGKPRFELRGNALELVGVPVPDWTAAQAPAGRPGASRSPRLLLRRHSRLYALMARELGRPLKRLLGGERDDPYPQYQQDAPAWRLTRALLVELRERVQARGARLALVIVPEARHLLPGASESAQRVVLRACDKAGIPALDLTPALRAATEAGGAALYHRVDGHWTADGHMLAARELERFLRERGLP